MIVVLFLQDIDKTQGLNFNVHWQVLHTHTYAPTQTYTYIRPVVCFQSPERAFPKTTRTHRTTIDSKIAKTMADA